MTARPTVPLAGEYLYDELGTTAPHDDANGWALLILVGALGATLGPLHDLVRDRPNGKPGWSRLGNPDDAPAFTLRLAAAMVGVSWPDGTPEAEQRQLFRDPSPLHRGGNDAIKAAGRRHLTGTQMVRIAEVDAYNITAVTRTSESPDAAGTYTAASPGITYADLLPAVPAWIVLTHVVSDATIIDELPGSIDSLTGAIDSL